MAAGKWAHLDRPTLRDSRLRVLRAGQICNMTVQKINEYELANRGAIKLIVDRAQFQEGRGVLPILDWSAAKPAPVAEIAVMAGEVIYNLRCALDYLIYQLAWLDSGAPQEMTQFPVEDRRAKYWGQLRGGRLRGVSEAHALMLEEYQPFRACEWIEHFQRLSNDDKHKLITKSHRMHGGQFKIERDKLEPHPDDPAKAFIPMKERSVGIFFDDETPVAETLVGFVTSVGRIVERFGPEFGENSELTITEIQKNDPETEPLT